jgi:hypothetical protein
LARRAPSILQILLILAGVAGIIWLWSSRSGGPSEQVDLEVPPAFDEALVEEILFERGQGLRRVVREADGFWIHDPYRDRADERFLAQSLRVAATLKPERTLPDTVSALFGLQDSTARWSCRWPGGDYEIVLGDTLPAGAGRFARTSASPNVIVVNGFLARRFLSPPFREIHQPMAAALGVGRLDSVRVETREEKLCIVRHPGGDWEIVSPVQVRAAVQQMERAVKTLRTETMTEFLGPVASFDLEPLGLDPPRATWTLVQGARRETVRIGHPTSDQKSVRVIPAGRDVVALIGSEQFRIWVDGMKRLRYSKLLETEADQVAGLEIAGPERQREFLRRSADDWVEVAGSDTLPVRSEALEIAAGNLCAAHAVDFAPLAASGTFRPRIRLYLIDLKGVRDTVELGMPQGDLAEVRTRGQPGICLVPADGFRTWQLWLQAPLRPVDRP